MGLFDYIKCDYPLPDQGMQNAEFQTKDTDAQYMEMYRITTDGRLIHETVTREAVPKSERPYPDAEDWRAMIGCIRRIPTGDVEIPYHGDICFYASDKYGGWHEYVARFTEGRLTRIIPSPHVPASS